MEGSGDMAKTVMIVEDNELNMKLFHDLLEAHGYDTIGTRNGIEALDLARKHRPDLVLMDIQLPDIDGITALAQLRADPATAKTPVVAVSASVMPDDQQRIVASGFDAYVTKPINIKSFIQTVEQFVGKP